MIFHLEAELRSLLQEDYRTEDISEVRVIDATFT